MARIGLWGGLSSVCAVRREGSGRNSLKPRTKLIIAIPLTAAVVVALVYLRLFSNPFVIALIFALWVAVSLRNKRKFGGQKGRKEAK